MFEIDSTGISIIGCVRDINEDNMFLDGKHLIRENSNISCQMIKGVNDAEFHNYAVFDGMGGASMGDLASSISVSRFKEFNINNLEGKLQDYISAINKEICEVIKEQRLSAMGTTVAVLGIKENRAFVCNVGDSRVYRYKDGELLRLSHDHTIYQMNIDAGLNIKDASRHKNVLTQYIGVESTDYVLEPFYRYEIVNSGDIFLLCSDGLTESLSDDELCNEISDLRTEESERICKRLIDKALQMGSRDNITAIVVKVK